jgi:hypothetical protein
MEWERLGSDLDVCRDVKNDIRGEVKTLWNKETGKIVKWVWRVYQFEEIVMQGSCDDSSYEARKKVEEIIGKLQGA